MQNQARHGGNEQMNETEVGGGYLAANEPAGTMRRRWLISDFEFYRMIVCLLLSFFLCCFFLNVFVSFPSLRFFYVISNQSLKINCVLIAIWIISSEI